MSIQSDIKSSIKSIQRGTLVFAGGDANKSGTISAVNTLRVRINSPEVIVDDASGGDMIYYYWQMINSTTVRCTRNLSGGTPTCPYEVIEYR